MTIMRGPCSSGVQRSRSSVSSICRTRAAGVTCSCFSVAGADDAVGGQAVALLEAPSRRRPARLRNGSAARRRTASGRSGAAAQRRPGLPAPPAAAPAAPGRRRAGPAPACRPGCAAAAAAAARAAATPHGRPARGSGPAPRAGASYRGRRGAAACSAWSSRRAASAARSTAAGVELVLARQREVRGAPGAGRRGRGAGAAGSAASPPSGPAPGALRPPPPEPRPAARCTTASPQGVGVVVARVQAVARRGRQQFDGLQRLRAGPRAVEPQQALGWPPRRHRTAPASCSRNSFIVAFGRPMAGFCGSCPRRRPWPRRGPG